MPGKRQSAQRKTSRKGKAVQHGSNGRRSASKTTTRRPRTTSQLAAASEARFNSDAGRNAGSDKRSSSRGRTPRAGLGVWDDFEDSIQSHRRSNSNEDSPAALGKPGARRGLRSGRASGRQQSQASRH